MIALRASKNAKLYWTACVLVPIMYTHLILPFKTHEVCSPARATRTLAAASIQEWRVFRSACLEVRQQFKSGV